MAEYKAKHKNDMRDVIVDRIRSNLEKSLRDKNYV